MATISELTLKVEVKGDQLKVLSAQLSDVSKKSQDAGKKGSFAFGIFGKEVGSASHAVTAIGKGVAAFAGGFAKVVAVAAVAGFGVLLKQGVDFNAQLETSRLGIAAILSSTQKVTDQYGRQVAGAEKFAASVTKAKDIQDQLRIINLETSATSGEILAAYQGMAAPAAAAGIEIDNQLQLTKLIIQATGALGLKSDQVTQEARDLLSATVDRNSQLAVSLGITNEQLKQAKEEGRLFEFLNEKLGEFARAGKETQTTFAGIKSNTQDALAVFSAEGFRGFFDFLKSSLLDVSNELITIEDGQIIVNQKWLEMARTISDVLVGALDLGFKAAGGLLNAMSGGIEVTKNFFSTPATFGTFRQEIETSQVSVDLLSGSYGLFIDDVKLSEGIYRDTSVTANDLAAAMGNMASNTNAAASAWANAKGPLDDYFNSFIGWLKQAATFNLPGPAKFAGLNIEEQKKQNDDARQSTIAYGRSVERLGLTLGETGEKSSDVDKRFGKLNLTFNTGGETAYDFATAIQTTGDESEGAGKKANTLANEIQKLKFEIAGIGKSPEEMIALDAQLKVLQGDSAELAEEWARLKIIQSRGLVGQETLDNLEEMVRKTQEETAAVGLSGAALRKHELAVIAANIEWSRLPEDVAPKVIAALQAISGAMDDLDVAKHKEELVSFMEGLRTESQKLGDELAKSVNSILQVAADPELAKRFGLDFEKAKALIIKLTADTVKEQKAIEQQAYIDRLKASDSFFDQLKGGFLEFVTQVESNGELVSQFFADTLSQMSQNFSDLFYNVLTGKFKDLEDLAKNAFKAILRAFLDMVSAIATKQLVISIGGLFGFGKEAGGGQGGGGPLDIGKQAAGVVGGGFDLFGSGGAFATLGAGLGIGGAGALAPAGALVGIPIASGASVFGSASSGALLAPGFLATAGAAITIVGAVLGIAALAFSIIAPLLQKTPRLDIDFDSVKTEAGRRAALVGELLDDDFLKDEIIDISVKRKAGLGLGGDEGIKDVLADAIQGAVDNLLAIINKLPADLAETLTEQLLATPLDIETEVAGERLFEFDAKGKKIGEKFNQLINGEIQAKFLFAVDGFLETMLESLGVLPEKASEFIQAKFEEFKNAGSREARAAIGQELLADLNAFVDAFNIVNGNVNDVIGTTIDSIQSLSRELGFEAVPSIGELKDALAEMLENAELDPETVQKYADLRNAIVQAVADITASITGLIGKIGELNSTIVGLGGAAVDIGPFLDEAAAKITEFFQSNKGDLSLGEQEVFLDEILGIANAKLAEERAAFDRAQAAQQKAAEAARARVQQRIDNLNDEKDKINEVFRERIDALNEELRIAESFKSLTESIRETLDSILFSPESVLTGVEQVNALQASIAGIQADLARTTDPEKQLDLAGDLEEALKTLFDIAGDAFGVNSPEFVAIFDQVTGGLSDLADMTEARGRTVEEISAEIERLTAENEATLKSIGAKIETAQERLAAIGQDTANNTFHASKELTDLFEFIRSEYIRILEERFAQLGEVSEFGFENEVEGLGVIAGFMEENVVTLRAQTEEMFAQSDYLKQIAERLGAAAIVGGGGVTGFAEGGILREPVVGVGLTSGSRYAFRERGVDEAFMPVDRLSSRGASGREGPREISLGISIKLDLKGATAATVEALPGKIEDKLVMSIRKGGKLRKAIKEAARSAVN